MLVGGGADEAPEVYKRLPEVLTAHTGSVRVKHTLRPLGVAMAGRDMYSPTGTEPRGPARAGPFLCGAANLEGISTSTSTFQR